MEKFRFLSFAPTILGVPERGGVYIVKRTRLKNKLAIVVDENIIEEIKSDKLLGVVVNRKLTGNDHFLGDNKMSA